MNGVGPALGDGVGDGVCVGDGSDVGEGELVGQGVVGVAPPVALGVAAAEPQAPTMMTVIMAAPTPRQHLAQPDPSGQHGSLFPW
jgi:hypothetical protein